MITPDLKDRVLDFIVERAPEMFIPVQSDSLATEMSTNRDVIESLLEYFQNRGLISYKPVLGIVYLITIKVEAHDMKRRGGFVGEEEMLLGEFNKLVLELQSLQSTIEKNKFEKIMTRVNTVISFFGVALSKT